MRTFFLIFYLLLTLNCGGTSAYPRVVRASRYDVCVTLAANGTYAVTEISAGVYVAVDGTFIGPC